MPKKVLVQPFPFEKLKKYSQGDLLRRARLLQLFPISETWSPILEKTGDVLKKYVGEKPLIYYQNIFDIESDEIVSNIPERFVMLVVSLTPLSKKITIALDSEMALVLIDRILGGSGRNFQMGFPLTSLEEGVLEFLVVGILNEWNAYLTQKNQKLKLDKIITKVSDLKTLFGESQDCIGLKFGVKMGGSEGSLALHIPQSLLGESRDHIFSFGKDTINDYYQSRLSHLMDLKTIVWGELGRVMLSSSDIQALERGDIILFDDTKASLTSGHLSGNIAIRLGELLEGGIEATLVSDENNYTVKVGSLIYD